MTVNGLHEEPLGCERERALCRDPLGCCAASQGSRTLGGGPQTSATGGLLFARWLLAQHLERVVHRYERVLLTRSDFLHCTAHPPLDASRIWIPRGEEDWWLH